jgi:uncharacterized protein YjeT (DUF2065 family)
MGDYWLAALGLMLVLEGIMPFLFPAAWRNMLSKVSQFQDGQARFIGLTLMLGGLFLIYWIK